MGSAFPEITAQKNLVMNVIREEQSFLRSTKACNYQNVISDTEELRIVLGSKLLNSTIHSDFLSI
jgi:hypothetical protein